MNTSNNNILYAAILSLILVIIGATFVLLPILTTCDPSSKTALISGGFAIIGSVSGYWLGSSSGSHAKDATINNALQQGNQAASINADDMKQAINDTLIAAVKNAPPIQ